MQSVQRTIKYTRKQHSHSGIYSNRISKAAAALEQKNNLTDGE